MKKSILGLFILGLLLPVFSFANVTRQEFLTTYSNSVANDLPNSYQYIQVKRKGVTNNTGVRVALQKLIYKNYFDNKSSRLQPNKAISEEIVFGLLRKNHGIDWTLSKKEFSSDTLKRMLAEITPGSDQVITIQASQSSSELLNNDKDGLLNAVYTYISKYHYDSDLFTGKKLLYGALQGLAEASNDQFTVFMQPAEAKSFLSELEGELEGIGAYIEMKKDGQLTIIAPIAGSPAELAGLKAGDIIIKIDDFNVTKDTTIQDSTSKIKGKADTKVKITVLRGDKTLSFDIIRKKITITFIEDKVSDNNSYLIQIREFGFGVSKSFTAAMNRFKESGKSKLIIDLRNNPGGSLDEVADMLSHFVPKNEVTVRSKSKLNEEKIVSQGYTTINRGTKRIIILINKGSASASEIMAGTIKDYLPETILMGEQSFGKGSVQSLESFSDGSSLKYTIAKRYTGKTKKSIDKVGVTPDVVMEDKKTEGGIDMILDAALQK